jgi:putative FmdB family regulatory protein
MPLYEYECDACGGRFEVIQKFSEVSQQCCRTCGKGPVRRLQSAPGIQFKGTGWYVTDYAQKGKSGGESQGKSGDGDKAETKKSDGGSAETSTKSESASGSTKSESTKSESTRSESTRSESTRSESTRSESTRATPSTATKD